MSLEIAVFKMYKATVLSMEVAVFKMYLEIATFTVFSVKMALPRTSEFLKVQICLGRDAANVV